MFALSRMVESQALSFLPPGAPARLPYQNIRIVMKVGPPKSPPRADLDQGASHLPATPHGIWRIICPCEPGSPTSLPPIISQDPLDGANHSNGCTGELSGQGRTAGQVFLYVPRAIEVGDLHRHWLEWLATW